MRFVREVLPLFVMKQQRNNNNSMKSVITLIFSTLIVCTSYAQPSERFISRHDYVEMWKDEAISQMVKYNIPASITLAQGMLESGNGNSALAKYAKNHFGIKCHGWDGPGIYKDDDKNDECFRKYNNAFESFEDHSKFLANRKRYQFLFSLDRTDYEAWAKGLRKAGYATNPKYANLLIELIETNALYQYDKMDIEIAQKETIKNNYETEHKLVLPPVKANTHNIFHHYKTKYILAQKGDTYYKIAKEFDMALWQLYNYNDCGATTKIKTGERIYLQPKKNKVKERIYSVQSGETLRSIAQEKGVKLKKLLKKNKLTLNDKLTVGQKLKLK